MRSIRTRAARTSWSTPVSLTALEFSILRTLLARPGFVFTRELILDAAYAGNIHVADRTIDSHVRNIRAKMAAAGCESVIETVHGVGFKLGAARHRVDRRPQSGARPATEMAAKPQPGGFSRSDQRALLPLFSLFFLKVYQNQLIQQTEAELIAQSAALGAIFHREIETGFRKASPSARRFRRSRKHRPAEPYQPIWPRLELETRRAAAAAGSADAAAHRPIPPSSRSARA